MSNLVELFDNVVEFQNYNGVPLAAGKLYVYALGRTRLMDTWSDVDGESLNPNPIILDDLGQCHCYCSDDFDYTLVICDQYNNEIFSLDKYLYSKGSHSHADVAVAPSESIAVSSYHVGECTVYVPYLTGQLGKVYEGIDPIVVNNQVDKISANHVPLGVQDPLYFVQDDEEGCIIGCSAQTEIPSALSSKWDEASDVVIANSAQWAEGTTYEAGSYVDIDGNTINVTGVQPAGNYQSAGDYVSASELENLQPKGDYYSASNPSGFITGVDLTDYAKTEDLTAYQPVGDYYSASNPSGFINSDAISAMATTGFVADVSGDITALIPSTAGLATEDWVTGQGYLTAHQSLDGLMSADLLEISDNKITGYNGTAFAGQGGGVTGDYELSAGSGISIVDYPLEQKTVISVTAQGGNPEVEQAVIDNSATWETVSDKLDSAIYANDSATFLTALPSDLVYTADIQDMATTGDLTGKQDITGMTAYATVESLTAKQDAGNYLSATDSANFLLTSDSANFYPSDNPSAFITGVDLTPYQTVEGMTAYQPAGSYLTTADSANFYTTANESGYITGVPDTYLQNTDLATSDGKVTAISGIPLSAGSDVPEGVMVESAVEYNAVNEISGYNGSAIAQYGAEKQWLVHDDTLVHAANSAQYALGVNLSAVAQLLGVDETELLASTANNAFTLSEPFSSFKQVKIKLRWWDKVPDNYYEVERFTPTKCSLSWTYLDNISDPSPLELLGASWTSNNGIDYTLEAGFAKVFATATTAISYFTHEAYPLSIIGIGRKQ